MQYYPISMYCQKNGQTDEYNSLNCVRYSVSFTLSIIIIIASTVCSYKTYRNAEKFIYELIPMILCILQGIIHALQFSIINENHMTLVGNLMQIIVFSLVGHSFSQVYQRIASNEQLLVIKKKKGLTMIQIIFLIIFGIQFLCICLVKTITCNIFFYIFIVFTLIIVFTTTSLIIFYGKKLGKSLLLINDRFSLQQQKQSQSIQQLEFECDLPKEKIYQIKLVVFSITVNSLIYISIMITLYFLDRDLLCDLNERQISGTKRNVILFAFTLTQLFPCLIVPYAFNYRSKQIVDTSDGLEFQRDRTLSSRFKMDDNDEFVNRITKGRPNQERD